MFALRDYQHEAIVRVRAMWNAGDRAVLGQAATGLGKTVIGVGLLRAELLDERGRMLPGVRAIWIAHRNELLEQPLAALRRGLPEARCGLVKAAVRQYDRDVVVASVQSLHRARLGELPWFTHVIIDEAHHAEMRWQATCCPIRVGAHEVTRQVVGNSYGILLAHLHRAHALRPPGTARPRVLGLTATPFRGDENGLGGCFPGRVAPDGMPEQGVQHGAVAFAFDLAWGVEQGWLCGVRGLRVETGGSLADVRTVGGDFNQADLARAVNVAARNRAIAEAWRQHAGDGAGGMRPTIAFAADVGDVEAATGHVFTLRDALRVEGARAEAAWGAMPAEDRRDVLARFLRGDLDAVVNCGVLTEGFDAPRAACLVMARPTKSLGLYMQMLGRGTRTADGKADCLVLDCVDATRTTGGVRTLLDLSIPGAVDHEDGQALDGKTCKRAGCTQPADPDLGGYCSPGCAAWRPPPEDLPHDEQGRVDWHAHEFDLFTGAISWAHVGHTRVLGLGDGRVVTVYPDVGGHVAAVVECRGDKAGHVEWLTFGAETEAEALAAAERMLRRSGVHGGRLVVHAHGRTWAAQQQATEPQCRMLARYGFDGDARDWSRQRASAVIDWCLSREWLARARGDKAAWNAWRRRQVAQEYAAMVRAGTTVRRPAGRLPPVSLEVTREP